MVSFVDNDSFMQQFFFVDNGSFMQQFFFLLTMVSPSTSVDWPTDCLIPDNLLLDEFLHCAMEEHPCLNASAVRPYCCLYGVCGLYVVCMWFVWFVWFV